MLTDVFFNRYAKVVVRDSFAESDRRFLVQSYRIIEEQLFPYYENGKEKVGAKQIWEDLNKTLAMELGLKDLSQTVASYTWTSPQGTRIPQSYVYPKHTVCENFMLAKFDPPDSPDQFIKVRLSFVELAFRKMEQEISQTKAVLMLESERPIGLAKGPLRNDYLAGLRRFSEETTKNFQSSCAELNARMQHAGYNLNYHNGFIQLANDALLQAEIDKVFWNLVAGKQWANVDVDIKEAIDLRDNQGRDPAFYAARALESAIKIVSDIKGLTTGNERGAANFIDNLVAGKGTAVLALWEADLLKAFFKSVRNPLGHGPGSGSMTTLTATQTDWAIHYCMIWIRNLVQRA